MKNTFIYLIIFIAIIAIGVFVFLNFRNNDTNTNNTNSSYNASRTDVNININDNNIDMNVNDLNSNTENIINPILPTYTEVSSFTTKIYDKDSARQNNIQITCNTLNNAEVLPGATFSFTSIIRKGNN